MNPGNQHNAIGSLLLLALHQSLRRQSLHHIAEHCDQFYDMVALFIDGTLQQIACSHPCALAVSGMLGDLTFNLLQEAMFCYKKYHALKFQAVIAPCGIAVSAFGPIDGR